MAKLSVIVPVYNVEDYLATCLDSVIGQTLSDLEIIIVNDGSKDYSRVIIEKYEREDSRIRVISQENSGLPSARNVGISVANGDYIGFVDSDDVVDSRMFERLVNAIESELSDLSVCNVQRFDKEHSWESNRYKNDRFYYQEDPYEFFRLGIDSVCNKVFRSEIIKKNSIQFESKEIVPQEDFLFLLKYLSRANVVTTISDCLYRYRIRQGSITSSKQNDGFYKGFSKIRGVFEMYIQQNRINREIKGFCNQLSLEMLSSSINHSTPNSPKSIRKIVDYFCNLDNFQDSLIDCLARISRKKHDLITIYTHFLLILLKYKMYSLYSLFEFIRVRRLNKKLNSGSSYQ